MNQKGQALLIILLIAAATFGYLIYSGKIMFCATQPGVGSWIFFSSEKCSGPGVKLPLKTDETANWRTYTNNKYVFKYPNDWIDKTNEIDKLQGMVRLIFLENGKEYYFVMGSKDRGLEGLVDSSATEDKKIGDIQYTKTIWSKKGIPVLIIGTPKNFSVNGLIEMQLPSKNTEYYQEVFDQILSTFKSQ